MDINFIYKSVDRHLACFHFLARINTAAMNISVQDFSNNVYLNTYFI